ncbi:AraC family transcriptional regulator [Chitinophaga rhizophila]|uniref:Helix-turn-helix transcriptional regulator n=1 Tax=Chitinophaga rhizophila TaxID=2866212 RepID=A0ABS7G905_9BACT|nr:AraC family transcriptional regulator [Chitinophaga rhizophila]MBW8684147.1 helix-turn-helix transcriptional regulator [Chitinophaga rhizophila]
MPIEFRLPGPLAREAVVTHAVPARYRKLRLPVDDTVVYCTSGKWGTLLQQEVQLTDGFYCELYIEPAEDLTITLAVARPLIIVHTVMSGSTRMTYPASHIQLQAGKIGLQYLSSDVEYSIRLTAGEPFRSIYLQAPVAMLQELTGAYPQLHEMLQAVAANSTYAAHLPYIRLNSAVRTEMGKMRCCSLTGQVRNQYYSNRISDIVISYLDSMHRITLQDSRLILLHEKEIDEFIERVDKCPEEHVNVEQRAHALGLTERALENAFKLKLGSTVKIYVLQQRLEKAKQLLVETMRSITDIAMEVGYSDPSYFIRIFKQSEGVTPGRYRSDHSATV